MNPKLENSRQEGGRWPSPTSKAIILKAEVAGRLGPGLPVTHSSQSSGQGSGPQAVPLPSSSIGGGGWGCLGPSCLLSPGLLFLSQMLCRAVSRAVLAPPPPTRAWGPWLLGVSPEDRVSRVKLSRVHCVAHSRCHRQLHRGGERRRGSDVFWLRRVCGGRGGAVSDWTWRVSSPQWPCV